VKATAPESLGQAKDKPMVPKDFSHSRELQPKAHRLIPGGAHTYAKGDDQFPEQAPGFIVRGKAATLGMWTGMNSSNMAWV